MRGGGGDVSTESMQKRRGRPGDTECEPLSEGNCKRQERGGGDGRQTWGLQGAAAAMKVVSAACSWWGPSKEGVGDRGRQLQEPHALQRGRVGPRGRLRMVIALDKSPGWSSSFIN